MKWSEVSIGCFSIKYSNEGMRLLTRLFPIDGVGNVRDGQDQRRDVPRAQLLPDLGLKVIDSLISQVIGTKLSDNHIISFTIYD